MKEKKSFCATATVNGIIQRGWNEEIKRINLVSTGNLRDETSEVVYLIIILLLCK